MWKGGLSVFTLSNAHIHYFITLLLYYLLLKRTSSATEMKLQLKWNLHEHWNAHAQQARWAFKWKLVEKKHSMCSKNFAGIFYLPRLIRGIWNERKSLVKNKTTTKKASENQLRAMATGKTKKKKRIECECVCIVHTALIYN